MRLGSVFPVAIGVLLATLAGSIGKAPAARTQFSAFTPRGAASAPVVKDSRLFDRMGPQEQAEALLELAVGRSEGATDQIASRLDRWQGKVKWNSQIASLTTAALNSTDMRVREAGIEVELAAYGLTKNSGSVEYLLKTADSRDRKQRIWALWALGLMGNRAVETDRVVRALTGHLKDSDQDSRLWAVQALALVGGAQTVGPLLKAMHDDPAALVREEAAGALAGSGVFTPQ